MPSKAMSKVQTIVCCSKCYQNDFRDKAKVPRREALASFLFFNFNEIFPNVHNL